MRLNQLDPWNEPIGPIVRQGVWKYDEKQLGVCITLANRFRGTGDDEDPEEIRYDRDVPAYLLWYESPVDLQRRWSWHGQFLSVAEAMEAVVQQVGCPAVWK